MDDPGALDEPERARKVEQHLKEESRLYALKHAIDALLPVILVALPVVLYLEFFADLTHAQHEWVLLVERVILFYFVLELAVDLALYENNRTFLKHKWFDILLVIPFLTVFREVTRLLRFLKLLKPVKPVKAVKTAKGAKVAKTAKGVKGARALKARKHLKRVKIGQKITKTVKKGKRLIRELLEEDPDLK